MRSGYFERAAEYLNRVQALQDDGGRTTILLQHGHKYARVVRFDGSQHMVHSFLRYDDGAVLKADGWKRPELKHPRSNIFDADYGMSGVGQYGANYL